MPANYRRRQNKDDEFPKKMLSPGGYKAGMLQRAGKSKSNILLQQGMTPRTVRRIQPQKFRYMQRAPLECLPQLREGAPAKFDVGQTSHRTMRHSSGL